MPSSASKIYATLAVTSTEGSPLYAVSLVTAESDSLTEWGCGVISAPGFSSLSVTFAPHAQSNNAQIISAAVKHTDLFIIILHLSENITLL